MGSGARRIEAVTGPGTVAWYRDRERQLTEDQPYSGQGDGGQGNAHQDTGSKLAPDQLAQRLVRK